MRQSDARQDELFWRAVVGDVRALRALLEETQRCVFTLAVSVVRNRQRALDLCGDALASVSSRIGRFDDRRDFVLAIYKRVYEAAAAEARRPRRATAAFEERHDVALRALRNDRQRARLEEALASLSPQQRAVLALREVNGLDYAQIATVMGGSTDAVGSRLVWARKRLQQALAVDEPGIKPLGAVRMLDVLISLPPRTA